MIEPASPEIKKRYIELDILRGIAIFLMILQHSWLIFSNQNVSGSLFSVLAVLTGTMPAAPIFLFLLGMNIVNSRKSGPKKLAVRGLKLIVLGYALSALRFFLPIILGHSLGVVNPALVAYGWTPLEYLLEVDIFQVAGLSLVAIAFFKRQKVKYQYYPFFAVLIALISPLLWPISFSNPILAYLSAPFFGTERYVLFPFFSWFFYPLAGFYFGNLLSRAGERAEFYKKAFANLVPIVILALIYVISIPSFPFTDYFHHGLGTCVLFSALIIYLLGIIYLHQRRWPDRIKNKLIFWSRNVTAIYVIQWLLIGWLAVFGNFLLGYFYLVFLTVAIFLMVDFLTRKLQFYLKSRPPI